MSPSHDDGALEALRTENYLLRQQITQLEHENMFLRSHPAILNGLRGEQLVAKLTDGALTPFAAQHDVIVSNGTTIEVKFSKLNTPARGGTTRRWNWSKPLGWKDKGKMFDFLLLIGEKDHRYPEQYMDNAPYVFFLLPHARVLDVMTSGAAIGGNIQLTTNLCKIRSPAAHILKSHMVGEDVIARCTSYVDA